MMTIQKPKRMWQKKKDYMRKKTIRGLRRKGKRILQSFDDGTDDIRKQIETQFPSSKAFGTILPDYTIVADPTFTKDKTGAGEIEYFNEPEITYANGYRKANPAKGPSLVYNPNSQTEEDIKLDLLHHYREYDPVYQDLLKDYTDTQDPGQILYNSELGEYFRKLPKDQQTNENWNKLVKENLNSQYMVQGIDGSLRGLMVSDKLRSMGRYPSRTVYERENLNTDAARRAYYNIVDYLTSERLPEVIVKPKRYKRGKDCFDIGTDDNEIPKRFWETEEEYQERLKNTNIEKYKRQQIEQKQRIAQMEKDRAVFLATPEGQKKAKKIRDEVNAFTKNIKHSVKINQPNNISKITDSVVDSLKKVSNMRNNVQEAIDNQEQERKEHARQVKNIVDATLTVGELGLSGLSLLRAFGNYRNWKNGSKLARGIINLLNKNQLPMQVGGALIDGYQTYDNFQKGDYKNGIYNTLSLTGGIAGSIGASDIFRTSNMYNPKIDKYLDITGVTQNIGDYLKFGYDTYNNGR